MTRNVEKAEKLLQKGKTADALADPCKFWPAIQHNDNVRQMAARSVALIK